MLIDGRLNIDPTFSLTQAVVILEAVHTTCQNLRVCRTFVQVHQLYVATAVRHSGETFFGKFSLRRLDALVVTRTGSRTSTPSTEGERKELADGRTNLFGRHEPSV